MQPLPHWLRYRKRFQQSLCLNASLPRRRRATQDFRHREELNPVPVSRAPRLSPSRSRRAHRATCLAALQTR